jgi:hypothetical protein
MQVGPHETSILSAQVVRERVGRVVSGKAIYFMPNPVEFLVVEPLGRDRRESSAPQAGRFWRQQ